MEKLISVIAPMYNEELLVEKYCAVTLSVLREIKGYKHEIILVNDGSSDKTFQFMMEQHQNFPNEIGVVGLSRNFGLEGAVNAGLRKAKGDIIVVMDADLQDPPQLIPQMLKKVENGADIVSASRAARKHDGFLKKITASLYYKLLNNLSGKLNLEKNAANYRMLTRKALNILLELPETNGVFRITVPYIGLKTDVVEYDRDVRFAGKTKYHFKSMFQYAMASITGISVEPLEKVLYSIPLCGLGFIISLIGIFVADDTWKMVWTGILFASIFTGILSACLSVIAIYLGEVLLEVKHRPSAIITEYVPSKNSEEV